MFVILKGYIGSSDQPFPFHCDVHKCRPNNPRHPAKFINSVKVSSYFNSTRLSQMYTLDDMERERGISGTAPLVEGSVQVD